jgi:hypothetical protein
LTRPSKDPSAYEENVPVLLPCWLPVSPAPESTFLAETFGRGSSTPALISRLDSRASYVSFRLLPDQLSSRLRRLGVSSIRGAGPASAGGLRVSRRFVRRKPGGGPAACECRGGSFAAPWRRLARRIARSCASPVGRRLAHITGAACGMAVCGSVASTCSTDRSMVPWPRQARRIVRWGKVVDSMSG